MPRHLSPATSHTPSRQRMLSAERSRPNQPCLLSYSRHHPEHLRIFQLPQPNGCIFKPAAPVAVRYTPMRTTFSAVILFDEGRLKGDSLEFGHFEGGISGNSDEVAVPSAAALALFIISIPGYLCPAYPPRHPAIRRAFPLRCLTPAPRLALNYLSRLSA